MESKELTRLLDNLESDNTVLDALEALESISGVYVANVIAHPGEPRFRRIRTTNVHFQERVGRVKGAFELLEALGFRRCARTLEFEANDPSSARLRQLADVCSARLERLRSQVKALPPRLPSSHRYTSVRGVGAADSIGPRPRMEDDHITVDGVCGDNTRGYFAVYDGHGGRGAVDYVAKALHLNTCHLLGATKRDAPSCLEEAHLTTDAALRRRNVLLQGTTTVVCMVEMSAGGEAAKRPRVLHCANTGDSRAVLSRGGRAVRLSVDHKPDLPEERKRIEALGGYVSRGKPPRVNGIIAVSRALGDHKLKQPALVSATPRCASVELSADDDLLILACDGVWDVMTDQEALDIVRTRFTKALALAAVSAAEDRRAESANPNKALEEASRALVDEALQRKTNDNVTVMVIAL